MRVESFATIRKKLAEVRWPELGKDENNITRSAKHATGLNPEL
jgi:hypothetical protein